MATNKKSTSGFTLILIWSLGLLFAFALVGVFFRIIFPLERNLDQSDYIEQVFLEFDTEYFISSEPGAESAGVFE
ncbi:MAG: hypothetical protein JJU37_03560, partial [Balneolaceae bacterium]|nr:hypothetical protein [Balneolaceae bacterium]